MSSTARRDMFVARCFNTEDVVFLLCRPNIDFHSLVIDNNKKMEEELLKTLIYIRNPISTKHTIHYLNTHKQSMQLIQT